MDESPKVIFNALSRVGDIDVSYRNLPHWFQVGAAMFVTFRTADSLPREVLERMKREVVEWLSIRKLPIELAASVFGARQPVHEELLATLSIPDRKAFRKRTDQLFHGALDECQGECVLRRPELARVVGDAILHQNGSRYDLDCFVVMPNHVHAIVQFRTDGGLSIIGQSWMRYSARLINRIIRASGAFWQPEQRSTTRSCLL